MSIIPWIVAQFDIANDLILLKGYCDLYPLILPYIHNTVHWNNIIRGIEGTSDIMKDFIVFEVTLTYI